MTVVTARLDERGRLVLPAKLRHRLDLHPGDELVIVDEPDGVRLKSRRVADPQPHRTRRHRRPLRGRRAAPAA
jgi:AbrB family looped-hinge helix DNA binding protein